jgi:hypothetical protein
MPGFGPGRQRIVVGHCLEPWYYLIPLTTAITGVITAGVACLSRPGQAVIGPD